MEHDLVFEWMPRRVGVPADPRWFKALLPPGVLGAYLLLQGDKPFYVGRSDHCLRTRLIGHNLLARATHVCWEVCRSPVHAFHAEAYWYDHFKEVGRLRNLVHPARPTGDCRPCPFCTLVGNKIPAALPFGGAGIICEGLSTRHSEFGRRRPNAKQEERC